LSIFVFITTRFMVNKVIQKLEWPSVVLLGKAVMYKICIEPLDQNRDSLKQKANLSIIARLKRNLE